MNRRSKQRNEQTCFSASMPGSTPSAAAGSPTKRRSPESTLVYVHVSRPLVESGAAFETVLEDINARIRERRGIVLADRQILPTPIDASTVIETYFDNDLTWPAEFRRETWEEPQQSYFGSLLGVVDPYQYAENPAPYDRFCFAARVIGPYLASGERAVALLECRLDRQHYYCTCHAAEVAYTSRDRLVCMSCGKLHCVLRHPLQATLNGGLTSEEWNASFDTDGELIADVEIGIVEYRDVFAAEKIWETDAWLEVSGMIEFLERGDPEEIARYYASLPSPDDFMEAGWSQVPMPPTPAAQLAVANFGVEIEHNAAAALNAAARSYGASRTDPDQLREAVLHAFQCIELLLKVKLRQVKPEGLKGEPNNPRVLARLAMAGVHFDEAEAESITALRKLRNKLQHAGAHYSYREVRRLLARALAFVDRFALVELGWWAGEVVEQPGWDALLALPSILGNAEMQAQARVDMVKTLVNIEVEGCPHCGRATVVRLKRRAGFCEFCRRIPG